MAIKVGGTDGGYVKKKGAKIKDGRNVYRILPSLGFNGKEPDNKPFKFYKVHFGYKNADGKLRVFQSPEVKNRETKMIEKNDAAKERLDRLKAEFEKAKEAGNKTVLEKLAPLVGIQKSLYNLDSNWYCNAIDESGDIVLLKMRHKCKLALETLKKSLNAKGIDPFGAENGRFIVIDRSGTGPETTFIPSVLTRERQVEGLGTVSQDVVHSLTPELLVRLEKEGSDLDTLFVMPSSEDVEAIVKASDLMTGKCPPIEEILKKKGAAPTVQVEEEPEGEDEETPTSRAAQAVAQTATVQVSTPVQVQETKPISKPVEEMADDEFLKSIGM